ncbi:MAG: LysM peptidoglycan-binding domain-containing protein [Lachnospiraceae bacterium]|jgi:nucleoid-associated protein YgaU|nr:LysM peptidoglycan-binding domain-containing protein [Lachnospiraceae bacterium]
MKRYQMIALIVMFSLLTFSGGVMVQAKERQRQQEPGYKYYTSILVESGDTLWEIAGQYLGGYEGSRETYIQEVIRLNGLQGDRIQAGQYLTIFYFSQEYK